jgi:hypothetical protein
MLHDAEAEVGLARGLAVTIEEDFLSAPSAGLRMKRGCSPPCTKAVP